MCRALRSVQSDLHVGALGCLLAGGGGVGRSHNFGGWVNFLIAFLFEPIIFLQIRTERGETPTVATNLKTAQNRRCGVESTQGPLLSYKHRDAVHAPSGVQQTRVIC